MQKNSKMPKECKGSYEKKYGAAASTHKVSATPKASKGSGKMKKGY